MARLDAFASDILKSGLVARPEIDRARATLPEGPKGEDPARLAKALILQGSLTPYQARKVLVGSTRGFFLGGYRILRRLGEGGMGKVYLAASEADGRRAAIKVLPPKKATQGKALDRFRREMDLSRRVVHPNLVRTWDVGVVDDVNYMIMEYVPGDSLYNVVKSPRGGPLRVPDAARYFLKVLDGLNAAHAGGLVHRDLKPSNLMMTPEGDAKILDLGLARAVGDEHQLTSANVVIGTLDYASPEQLSDAARADRRSDLYSLGCTIYFTLAGHAPFEGGDVVNKIYKQRMEDPEPLEIVAPGVPAAFAALVRKLMAKDPAERYQTGEALQVDLGRWTDPATVRQILGVEAETARAFRPPPPEIDDEDLRFLADDGILGSSSLDLRALGEPEPSAAPMHRPPPPPRQAVPVGRRDSPPAAETARVQPEDRWLITFGVVALALGILAVLIFNLTR